MANIRGSYQSGDQTTVIVIPDTANTTPSTNTRQQPELQTRKDLVDFGRTMKTTFKNLLFEDEGEELLTRIADKNVRKTSEKRPKVIGGRRRIVWSTGSSLSNLDRLNKYLHYILYIPSRGVRD